MNLSEFDFDLPADQIAQEPRARGRARLMVVRHDTRGWEERSVADLPALLLPGDLLVLNDTRVFPARLIGRRDPSGGAVECLLVERVDERRWQALVHPGQKLRPGARLRFEDALRAPGVTILGEILEQKFFGRRVVALQAIGAPDLDAAIDRLGHVPLPPYIHRADTESDRERYQTVFARVRGSVAAPTAGLHFDQPLFDALAARGIQRTTITHHVGYGTFKPVRSELVEDHVMDAEAYDVPVAAAAAIAAARGRGGRVVAVGTTTTRALESAADGQRGVRPGPGRTDLFVYPGYRFQVVDAIVTNFHLPRSSLLLLVAAFAGRGLILDAYRAAAARGFLFYSYGDAMLVL